MYGIEHNKSSTLLLRSFLKEETDDVSCESDSLIC